MNGRIRRNWAGRKSDAVFSQRFHALANSEIHFQVNRLNFSRPSRGVVKSPRITHPAHALVPLEAIDGTER